MEKPIIPLSVNSGLSESLKSIPLKLKAVKENFKSEKRLEDKISSIRSLDYIHDIEQEFKKEVSALSENLYGLSSEILGKSYASVKSNHDGMDLFKKIRRFEKEYPANSVKDSSSMLWNISRKKGYYKDFISWAVNIDMETGTAFILTFFHENIERIKNALYAPKRNSTIVYNSVNEEFNILNETFGREFSSSIMPQQPGMDNEHLKPDNTDDKSDILLNELINSGKTENARKYNISGMPTDYRLKPVFTGFSKLTEGLKLISVISDNYNINKHQEKQAAGKNFTDYFIKKCISEGLDTSVNVKNVNTGINTEFVFRNPTLFDNPDKNEKLPDIIYNESDTESIKDPSVKYYTLDELNNEYQTVEYLPEANTAFVSDFSTVDSELQRLTYKIGMCAKQCALNGNYHIVSISTRKSGGLIKNLKYAGNSRPELEDAINNINGGRNL